MTLRIPTEDVEGYEESEVVQWASTDHAIKYHVRRAYVRLLIEAMHRHEIEINLRVC